MKVSKITLSIIIVHYKVMRELLECIKSIENSQVGIPYEVIVIDNDEIGQIGAELKRKFPRVVYVKSLGNIGFGAGNNLGAKYAKGKYLLFLNPDTVVRKNAINELVKFIERNKNVGAVAPILLGKDGKAYQQGARSLGLLEGIVCLSFINKLFPNNKVSKRYFLSEWDRLSIKEVDVVPGTSFMISRAIFDSVGRFDEKFFLYFEEFDLCRRLRKAGYKMFIDSKAEVYHLWGKSTAQKNDADKIFAKSRFYYFKKHFGFFPALVVQGFTSFKKVHLLLVGILAVSAFLNFYKLEELMQFIGDQAWFYLSARDMLTTGQIPMVGIASSRPWLHQGPLWTYLLAPFLWIFNFDPVSGAYLSILIGLLTVVAMYLVGSAMFSKRVGFISAVLFSTSPLVVFFTRMPYHTSPIPVFVIGLIYSLYKITQNKIGYLPLTIFFLSILYNFEIATAVLWPVVMGVFGYKLFKKEISMAEVLNKKIIFLSGLAMLVPLLPMILYDIKNGFPQTLKFSAWIFYRVISLFGYNPEHAFSVEKILTMLNFLFINFTRLIYAQSQIISAIILVFLAGWMIYYFLKKKGGKFSYNLIFLSFLAPLTLIILNQTPSDAYLPILFPASILIISLFLEHIMQIKKMFIPVAAILIIIVFGNIIYMLRNDFAFTKSSKLFSLAKRIEVSKKILNITRNKDYNLIGEGFGSQHKSFIMNYEYLLWWLGNSPSKKNEAFKIYLSESEKGIKTRIIND